MQRQGISSQLDKSGRFECAHDVVHVIANKPLQFVVADIALPVETSKSRYGRPVTR